MSNPATLVASARADAGLSCRGLAARAGVAASTVTRIEDGEMDPTFTTLQRLLAAAGQRLTTGVAPIVGASLASLADIHDGAAPGTGIDWTRLRAFLDHLERHRDATIVLATTDLWRHG